MAVAWEISREKLAAALQILDLVPEKLSVPSSQFIWVRGQGSKIKMSLASTADSEVTLDGHGTWPLKKDFFLDRRVFLPFVYAAKEIRQKARFQFRRHHTQLIVIHGKRNAAYDTQKAVTGYGHLEKVLKKNGAEITVSDQLRELLRCGRTCAASDAITPALNCVYVSKGKRGVTLETYATNDKVFYYGSGDIEGSIVTSIPFPLMLIGLLDLKSLKKISWHDKYVVMNLKGGVIWQPISMEATKHFPLHRIQKHVKNTDRIPHAFTVSSRRFAICMIRLGYYLQSANRQDWVVKISGHKGEEAIQIETSTIPGSQFKERMRTTEPLKRSFELTWPLALLSEVLGHLAKKTKKLGLIVRVDTKHGVSYACVGNFWFAITSEQE